MIKTRLLNKATYVILAAVAAFVIYLSYDRATTTATQVGAEKTSIAKAAVANPQLAAEEAVITSNPASTPTQDSIVAFATELLGTPYEVAGCSVDGFDCSGFVYFVFQHFDIETPRSSASFEHFGKEIPIAEVQKGDLLLFLSPTRNAIGHIGIVSNPKGKASDFIHSSSGREMKVIVTNLSNEGYTRRFVKAVRVL